MPESCVLVTPGGRLPSVESRGDELNGTAYPSLGGPDADGGGTRDSSGSGSGLARRSAAAAGGGCGSGDAGGDSSAGNGGAASESVASRGVALRHEPNPEWLRYGGKWGSTVQVGAPIAVASHI